MGICGAEPPVRSRGPLMGRQKAPCSWKIWARRDPTKRQICEILDILDKKPSSCWSWLHCSCLWNIMIYCQKVGRLKPIWAVPLLKVGRLGLSHGDRFRTSDAYVKQQRVFLKMSTTLHGTAALGLSCADCRQPIGELIVLTQWVSIVDILRHWRVLLLPLKFNMVVPAIVVFDKNRRPVSTLSQKITPFLAVTWANIFRYK